MLVWMLLACKSADPSASPDASRDFPEGFGWGSATAGFQVDMGCPEQPDGCVDPHSDWYQWVTDPGIVGTPSLHVSGEPVTVGPGMWGAMFEADVARMQADGMNTYRFSLEWSRLFPSEAAFNADSVDALAALADADAVARYHAMLKALRDAGIEPLVTVNHYTLPLWMHDGVACHDDPDTCAESGWLDADRIIPRIALFAGFVGREFGGEVDRWATLNEPYATGLSGYLSPGEDRSSPPGLSFDFARTAVVMKNQLVAHARMTDALRAEDTADADGDGRATDIGIVMNMVAFTPRDPARDLDIQAVQHADYLYHQLYFDALTAGLWDDDLDGVPDETRADLADRLDYIGINYYNEAKVGGTGVVLAPELPLLDFLPEFSWDPYPEGLGQVLARAHDWGLPIWVTENGTPHVEDRGTEVLDGHLEAVAQAIADGVDVRGYLYWSYIDNYEWNHGMDLRFGLYTYDPVSKERAPRAVLERYREVMKTGAL